MIAESDDRLVTGEQFGVGGARFGRGLEERELLGDKGYRISLQSWAPAFNNGSLLGGFIDYGTARTNNPVEDEISSEDVTTLGLSALWQRKTEGLVLLFNYGYVANGLGSFEQRSQDGDSKAHFSLTNTW